MSTDATTVRPEPTVPPTTATDEAKPHQHGLAQAQGDAYRSALKHMAGKVAEAAAEQHAGDVIVAVAVEKAEGMYRPSGGGLTWQEPDGENTHVEVSVRDAADNRFVPGMSINVSIRDADGDEVAAGPVHFLWHPWLYHYGSNFALPGDGTYTIDVAIDPPTFPRHDKENGRRYSEPVRVTFTDITFTTGNA